MTHWFQNRYNHIDCASNHSTDAELRTILQRETSEWRGKIALREILIAWFIQHIWHSVSDLHLPLNVYPSSKITAARVGLFLNMYGVFIFFFNLGGGWRCVFGGVWRGGGSNPSHSPVFNLKFDQTIAKSHVTLHLLPNSDRNKQYHVCGTCIYLTPPNKQ